MNFKQYINTLLKAMPDFFWRLIDPTTLKIKSAVSSFSQELEAGSKILDAGAGEAPYKSFFGHCNYLACDFGLGDENWDYSKINFFSDLKRLPFKNGELDAVVCTQVFEHVNNPFQVSDEFYRVLKKGGRCIISAPQGWGEHQVPHDYFRYTSYGLSHVFKESGFSVDRITPSCGYLGYLANRLTVLPKVIFWQRKGPWRILLLPFELLSYLIFVLVLPIVLNLMDNIDKKQQYTLNYIVEISK